MKEIPKATHQQQLTIYVSLLGFLLTQYHKLSGLSNTLLSHSPRGWKSKIKVRASEGTREGSVPGPSHSSLTHGSITLTLLVFPCVSVSKFPLFIRTSVILA